jgi:hypothetical protein
MKESGLGCFSLLEACFEGLGFLEFGQTSGVLIS